ncbi:MAG: STN domain-containing protein, partial [Opitutaceae bacterium]
MLFLMLAVVCALPGHAANATKTTFDVPADSAERSLKKFSTQSGVDVLFVPEAVANVTTKAIKGDYTPGDAMQQMLTGTTLIAEQDRRTGTIRVLRNAGPNAPRAAQTRSDRPVANPPVETVSVRTARPAGEDKAIVLSPFEVTTEKDTG